MKNLSSVVIIGICGAGTTAARTAVVEVADCPVLIVASGDDVDYSNPYDELSKEIPLLKLSETTDMPDIPLVHETSPFPFR